MERSKAIIIYCIIVVVIVSAICIITRVAGDPGTSAEVEQLRNDIAEYKQLLADSREEATKLAEENKRTEEQLRTAVNTVESLETRIGNFAKRFGELQSRYNELERIVNQGTESIENLSAENQAAIENIRKLREEYREARDVIESIRKKD